MKNALPLTYEKALQEVELELKVGQTPGPFSLSCYFSKNVLCFVEDVYEVELFLLLVSGPPCDIHHTHLG